MNQRTFHINPLLCDAQLNEFFAASWPDHHARHWSPILSRSLCWIGAFDETTLIGFVYVAWNGDEHAWLLDPTVHPHFRRRGIGTTLIKMAIEVARERNVRWLHVDYQEYLSPFYAHCGFTQTHASLLKLS